MNQVKQHSLLTSVLLHLLPGASVLIAILAFSHPSLARTLGFDPRLSPVLGYLLGLLVGLLPVQIGILLAAAKGETGSFRIGDIIPFKKKSRLVEYLVYVPAFIIYWLALFAVVAPLIQPVIIETFFQWWPDEFNFQLLLQDPAQLAGLGGIQIIILFYILLSCITGPLVEEVYFRGYLLPRMEGYAGKWAPLWNTILFSLYHFFSPWENLIRVAASYPLNYMIWKKQDIRYGILVHILVNTIGGIGALVMILTN